MRLQTIPQFAEEHGFSVYQVKELIRRGQLRYVWVLSQKRIPEGAFEEYIQNNLVSPCQDETKDRASDGLKSGGASTSSGARTDAAASARRAQGTAKRLRSLSQSSSKRASATPAPVIQLRSS